MDGLKSSVRILNYGPAACTLMMRGTELVNSGRFVECLDFIHDVFISELEMAMSGVAEALTTFEEKCE